MIRIFCQFSYGGYKVFRINGTPHEELQRVIPGTGNDSLPLSADRYFNYGGAKLVYRYLDSNMLTLAVCDIPGPQKDSDGRPVSCAIQFIGEESDRDVLDRLSIRIANDLEGFSRELVAMFDLWGGLFFNGDKLTDIVKECEPSCSYEGSSRLLDIRKRKGNVLLFVPFSDNFGRDEKVTSKILNELELPDETREEDRFIRLSELMRIQYLVKPLPAQNSSDEATDKTEEHGDVAGEDDRSNDNIGAFKAELDNLHVQNSQLRASASAANKELDELKANNTRAQKMLCICGTLIGLLLFILIVTKCYTLSWILSIIIAIIFSYKTFKLLKK